MSAYHSATATVEMHPTSRQVEAKALFNQAIEALLADDITDACLARARACLEELEKRIAETAEEPVRELRSIIEDVDRRIRTAAALSPREELELSERLFALYLDVSEGVLIW